MNPPRDINASMMAAIGLLLALAVGAAFAPAIGNGFINFDDPLYITQNEHIQQGLTWANVRWAFTTFDAANWHPLTWLSHMLDWELYHAWAGGHHLTSIALHIANTVILLLVLHRMTGSVWRSALVAALFGLHPLHVESVAWIAERKDVLSTLFGLLAIGAYSGYAKSGGAGRYLMALAWFALSLMSKPMLVTLPCVLLLLDWWPLRRLSDAPSVRRTLLEKVPFLALAAASAGVTLLAQSAAQATVNMGHLTIAQRCANAIVSYAVYLHQACWPVGLIPMYPHPGSWPTASILAAAAALILMTAIACWKRRNNPAILVGWLWYLGTLVPVIGLIQVGVQSHADRYAYFPLVGVFIMVAWSLPLPEPGRPRNTARHLAAALALAAVLICGWLTRTQICRWHDSETLFAYTLTIDEPNATAHFNLANALADQERLDEALAHYARAAELQPTWADPPGNMGNILAREGNLSQSIEAYERAIALRPDSPSTAITLANLAQVLIAMDRPADAVDRLNRAIALDPGLPDARITLGNALAELGRADDAAAQFDEARRLDPGNILPPLNKACVLAADGRIEAAEAAYRIAAALDPAGVFAPQTYGQALLKCGQRARGIELLQSARAAAARTGMQETVRQIDELLTASPATVPAVP